MTLRESLFLSVGIISGFCIGSFWVFRIVCRDTRKRIAALKSKREWASR
jgi:hypothetical protein